jgi:anion-transporting  ArsA/GET3 family ATPase
MPDLLDRDFLFVTGKGGAGKTTVSAALALAAARRGKRVLVAMCNAKERLSHLLEVDAIGSTNQRIGPQLEAVNMTPQVALEEYGLMILKVRSVYKAVFENRFVSAFLRGTPGIEAWALLGKATFHTKEVGDDGRRRYDLVIVDAPATGHALDMLRVPQVICDVAPPGLLRQEAEKALELMRDARRAAMVCVTLAEDMPANETIELHRALTRELRMPVGALVVNSVAERLFAPEERALVASLAHRLEGTEAHALGLAARQRALREGVQEEAIAKLDGALPALPRVTLPLLHSATFRRAELEALSERFA